MSERGIPALAVPDYSKLTILSQPQPNEAVRPAALFGAERAASISLMPTVHHIFLFIVSIRRNKADAARN
jgi:hypothetical protein